MYSLKQTPISYVEDNKFLLERKLVKFKRLFFTLNFIAILAGAFSSILVAIMISHLVYDAWPMWYFYASTAASALTTLVTSLLNFYVVRDTINKSKKTLNLISKEEALYHNKAATRYKGKSAEFNLYLSVGAILDSKAAKKAVKNG